MASTSAFVVCNENLIRLNLAPSLDGLGVPWQAMTIIFTFAGPDQSQHSCVCGCGWVVHVCASETEFVCVRTRVRTGYDARVRVRACECAGVHTHTHYAHAPTDSQTVCLTVFLWFCWMLVVAFAPMMEAQRPGAGGLPETKTTDALI